MDSRRAHTGKCRSLMMGNDFLRDSAGREERGVDPRSGYDDQ